MTQSPPPRANSTLGSPTKRSTYPQPVRQSINAWGAEEDDDDEEVDEEDDRIEQYYLHENADEDEFGLPCLTNSRREAKRKIPIEKVNDPGGFLYGGINGGASIRSVEQPVSRARANSSDIAEERGPPNYPTMKKSEGKILRPQYKDILRGWLPKRLISILPKH